MAKKRRLNRRLVVVLGILLAVILAMGGLGAYKYRDKLFPKDPVLYAARGDEAYGRGDYAAALRAYRVAAGASQNPVYYFKLARVELDWAIKGANLKDVERRKHYEQGRAFLNHALLLDARLLSRRCPTTLLAAPHTRLHSRGRLSLLDPGLRSLRSLRAAGLHSRRLRSRSKRPRTLLSLRADRLRRRTLGIGDAPRRSRARCRGTLVPAGRIHDHHGGP